MTFQREALRKSLAKGCGRTGGATGNVEYLIARAAVKVVVVPTLNFKPGTPIEIGKAMHAPVVLKTFEGAVHGGLTKGRAGDLRAT